MLPRYVAGAPGSHGGADLYERDPTDGILRLVWAFSTAAVCQVAAKRLQEGIITLYDIRSNLRIRELLRSEAR